MLSLAWSTMSGGQAQGKRKTRHLRRTFSTFGFFLFLLSVTPTSPWSIKGRAGHPTKGTDRFSYTTCHTTHSQAATELLASFRPFHQRLGTCPSLDRLYPQLRTFFGTNNMSSNKLDVGTFCLNQYKPCVL